MSYELTKGKEISIYEAMNNTGKLVVYFGWNEIIPKKTIFDKFKNKPSYPVDCDISVILLPDNNKLIEQSDLVFHNNKIHRKTNAVSLIGPPDDFSTIKEQVIIHLDQIPNEYERIIFLGTIYEADKRKQNFSNLENLYITIYNTVFNMEICSYQLIDNYKDLTSIFFGELTRNEFGWSFKALGNGSHDVGITQAIKRYTS